MRSYWRLQLFHGSYSANFAQDRLRREICQSDLPLTNMLNIEAKGFCFLLIPCLRSHASFSGLSWPALSGPGGPFVDSLRSLRHLLLLCCRQPAQPRPSSERSSCWCSPWCSPPVGRGTRAHRFLWNSAQQRTAQQRTVPQYKLTQPQNYYYYYYYYFSCLLCSWLPILKTHQLEPKLKPPIWKILVKFHHFPRQGWT